MTGEEMSLFMGLVSQLFEYFEEFTDRVGAMVDIARHLIVNIYYHTNTIIH